MFEDRSAGGDEGFAFHRVELCDRWLANELLDDRGRRGDVFNAAELSGIVADAVLAGDEEHDGWEVGGEDGAVVEGATDRNGQVAAGMRHRRDGSRVHRS